MSVPALSVGMSEIKITTGNADLIAVGLGSCVGVLFIDPRHSIAGMVHIMLPATFPDKPVTEPGKFANTGIEELLRLMEEKGAVRRSIVVAVTGGAQVFKFGDNASGRMDVGVRNQEAVKAELSRLGFRISYEDLGGSNGRTFSYKVETGEMFIKTISKGTFLLGEVAMRDAIQEAA